MIKGQKSIRNGIEDFLCPFTDMYITQGSGGSFSHKGTMANDVRGSQSGVKYPYYAPCTCKCVRIYPESGQSMWQSIDKVRFANGRIDYATFMIVHDDSFDARVGQLVKQGEQIGNMGTKGNATGVHCHIEISQSKTTTWTKNKYGIYCFPNEYDTDACYFVDNTNILNGLGGKWKKTTDVKVSTPINKNNKADQIIYKGSKVKFQGIFKVDIVNVKLNCFGNSLLTGCSFNSYKNNKVKPHHWIPSTPFIEVDRNGKRTKDQVLQGGKSYVKNDNVYTVKDIDIQSNSAKLNINGRDVWVFSKYLYEVSNK